MHKTEVDILFVNLPLSGNVYGKTNVSAARPSYPNLTLATLAGNIKFNSCAKLLDLEFVENVEMALRATLLERRFDLLVMTLQTVAVNVGQEVARIVRKHSPHTQIVVGGVHVTTFPLEFNDPMLFDLVVLGEGDFVLNDIVAGTLPPNVFKTSEDDAGANAAWYYHRNKKKSDVVDMNSLAFPRWDMFDLKRYSHSHLSTRKNPVGLIETSRGCAFRCNFCNKNTFGHFHRSKSPERVVEEFFYLRQIGFREVHVADDSFTQDLDRAKQVCELLIQRKFDLSWSLYSGVRVDRVDKDFFELAKQAGLWSVSFGIESGNQQILDRINKGTKLPQIEKSVNLAHAAGLDTFGFFILGLSGETEKSMQDTIDFSLSLPLSIAKFDICIPYPGTGFYQELEGEGRIKLKNWSDYVVHQTDTPLFEHPNLSWQQLQKYYAKAYRAFYLRPEFWYKRLKRDVVKGDVMNDFLFFLKGLPSLLWH